MTHEQSSGSATRKFIGIIIAVIVALVLSPLIFSSIKAANSSGNITGTLATIVNLVPLFYYLAVALVVIGDIYFYIKAYKQTIELRTPQGIIRVVVRMIVVVVQRSVWMIISIAGPPAVPA